ncbi:MAG: 2-oxoglutarate dehydrogenase complex dihydrolipoyllysine-residue succinyltransferase [Thermoguttaceae bacterium]
MKHELKVPTVGESIQEVQIGQWLKGEGQWANKDESLVEIESDKATVDVAAPAAGIVVQVLHRQGDMVPVGTLIGYLEEAPRPDTAAKPTAAPAAPTAASTPAPPVGGRTGNLSSASPPAPSAARSVAAPQQNVSPPPVAAAASGPAPAEPSSVAADGGKNAQLMASDGSRSATQVSALHGTSPRSEEIVPMTWFRRRAAERLVEAQNTGALLTTFNEVDMSAVIEIRQQYRDAFQERYNTKLGFMSFFVKAAIESLRACPELNAEIRDNNIVYRNFYDISIAVGGGKGLVVPVVRNAELLSFAEIEQTIGDFAARAKSGQLKPDELMGGTFTITNGGVFGSMLSTPIVNPPQSGILGLHAIQDRPVARNGQVVIRPMMYVALTYDHRIVDGREAVGFLRRVKEVIEDPARMLLEI